MDFRGVIGGGGGGASASPTAELFSNDIDALSIRDKTLLKRSVSKHHNNNFKAGYVPVHEQHLTKTGLRGRKTFAFWTLVGLLLILAIGNLILTITILGVLRLGQGMESIELIPDQYTIKFFGDVDLGHIYKRDGKIEGFKDEPVEIAADQSAILLNLSLRNGRPINKLRLNRNGTLLRGFESFEIKNKNGETIFTTSSPQFKSLKNARSLHTKLIETNRIVSPIDNKLKIEGRLVNLKGSEGTSMDGKEILWSADQDIYLNTINGSIILNGKDGVIIDSKSIPIITLKYSNFITYQYKICVCMPQGKLFKIPVPNGMASHVYCNHINMAPQHNPCI